jgi:hypothetical protein
MNWQLIAQLFGSSGITAVLGGGAYALFNRRKVSAESAKIANQAAKYADEAVAARMKSIRDELWDALDLSEQRRKVMSKMDNAIWTMRVRVERHAQWDQDIKMVLDRLLVALTEHNIDVLATVHDPPSLDMSDVDFDFTIHPPQAR